MNEIIGVTGGAAFAASFLLNEALKSTPLVNNKWLPLIGLGFGAIIGGLFGYFADTGHFTANLLMGMIAGGNSTTFNEIFKHLGGTK